MNISIPERLKSWVESRVADGSYASSGGYLRDLVCRDQRAKEARTRMQAEIDRELTSPESGRTIAGIIDEGRKKHPVCGSACCVSADWANGISSPPL